MLTALYDGKCAICQATCGTLRALDWLKRIEFVDLREADDRDERYRQLSRERLMSEIHVLDAEGKLHAGFAATRRMLKAVPLGLPLWLLLRLPGGDALGKGLYRFIARRRYRVNRLLGKDLPGCADGSCKTPR